MKRLKVGLVGLMQLNFRGDKVRQYRRSTEELEELSHELGFDFYAKKDGVVSTEDAEEAVKEIEDNNVDFLLLQNSSFASGYLIQTLARADAYIGLWAVPEPTKKGPLPLNSFSMFKFNFYFILSVFYRLFNTINLLQLFNSCFPLLFTNRHIM